MYILYALQARPEPRPDGHTVIASVGPFVTPHSWNHTLHARGARTRKISLFPPVFQHTKDREPRRLRSLLQ